MRTNVIAAPVCHAARFIRLFTILAVCAALFALPCSALTLKFTNENPDFPTSNAYVMFRSGVADPFVANY
ncbi:hypothetical protein GX586_01265, partial [bacterium]|nr:hypothetical protein [bacterium]